MYSALYIAYIWQRMGNIATASLSEKVGYLKEYINTFQKNEVDDQQESNLFKNIESTLESHDLVFSKQSDITSALDLKRDPSIPFSVATIIADLTMDKG
ncbi:hypothetical protein, partial [Piscirickettsia litoralis]|uniref:hypothetical protein n=1 Tax=Piscirickettsia litoralis TaxID=1891921 RepID=UPI001300CE31